MKAFKRILSLVVLLAMLLPVFGTALASDYGEKMDISWATVQVAGGVDYNADAFTTWWREKYNVDWEVISLTWDNWAERLRIWINSDDMTDIATWNYIHAEMAGYVDQELLRRLPDDWKERWPNVAKAYTDSVIGPQLEEIFDGTYCLPKPVFSMNKPVDQLMPHISVHMRKDWVEAVGGEIKDYYTVDELMEILRKIKAEDPGNVGGKLVPLEVRTGNMVWPFLYATSTHANPGAVLYKGDDGQYRWGAADEDTLEGLKLYQQAYREGLLHPEFFTLKQNEDLDDFYVAGTAAMTVELGLAAAQNNYSTYLNQNLGLDKDAAYHMAFIIGNDGKYHAPETINFWTANVFSPNMPEEKFERIMDILDFGASEEGQLMIRLGFEGEDWQYDENGELASLLEGQTVTQKYLSIIPLYINQYILSDDFGLIDPAVPKEYRERTRRHYELKASLSDEDTLFATDWDVYFHDSPSVRKIQFDYPAEYAQLILMDGDLETNWNNWISEKLQLVQPVLDELNAM